MKRKSDSEAPAETPVIEASSTEPRENGTRAAEPSAPADLPADPPSESVGPSETVAESTAEHAERPLPPKEDEPSLIEGPSPPDGEPSAIEAAPGAPLAFVPAVADLSPLELRVKRLEEAVAVLQGGSVREERIAAPPSAPPPPPLPTSIQTAVPAIPAKPPPTAFRTAPAAPQSRRRWLLWEIIAEFRVIVRMYSDPRYAMTWTGRLVPLALAFLIITSGYWGPWSYIPLLGWFLDKCVNLAMAFVLFKVLAHEARRYRETSPDLPTSLRL